MFAKIILLLDKLLEVDFECVIPKSSFAIDDEHGFNEDDAARNLVININLQICGIRSLGIHTDLLVFLGLTSPDVNADLDRIIFLAGEVELKINFNVIFALFGLIRYELHGFRLIDIKSVINTTLFRLFWEYLITMVVLKAVCQIDVKVFNADGLIVFGELNIIKVGTFLVDVVHDKEIVDNLHLMKYIALLQLNRLTIFQVERWLQLVQENFAGLWAQMEHNDFVIDGRQENLMFSSFLI